MEIAAVVERVGAIASVRADAAASVDLIESGLVAVREVQAWCDAQHAGLVTQLEGIDSFPEQRIANASKKSLGQAAKTTERSKTLTKTPELADALGDGAITADHIDADYHLEHTETPVAQTLIDEDLESRSRFGQYRHLPKAIEVVGELGYEEALRVYEDHPALFKDLII